MNAEVSACPAHSGVCEKVSHLACTSEDHDKRLRVLEEARWKNAGLIGLVSTLASFGGAILGALAK